MNRIAKQLMKIATEIIIAEELKTIASELQQFTGSEANLCRKELKKSIDESKEKIFNKYKGDNKNA